MKTSFKQMTDEQLVTLYANGDNSAFNFLLKRHKNSIYSYIFYTVRDADLADDIFQDTFVKAVMKIKQGQYTEMSKFKAWIMRIAHNLIIDYFRQTKNANVISNDEMQVDLFNNVDLCESTVEDNIIQSQILQDVRRLITFLPQNQREVLEMRYFKELSYKEIATATGVSINTALGRMRYAILNLRRIAVENNISLSLA